MKKENKLLLLTDLCMRLPYGVICSTPKGNGHLCSINQTIFGNEYGVNIKATMRDYFDDNKCDIKPYLRPMSSMTEEEKKIYDDILTKMYYDEKSTLGDISDYLNSIHVDYRGLIERGLAIAVNENNNPY